MIKVALVNGMSLSEFWSLTPGVFALFLEGLREREENRVDLSALHAAWLLNAWTTKRVTPEMLTGRQSHSVDVSEYASVGDAIEAHRERSAR